MFRIIGIDVGKAGAIATIDSQISLYKMPDNAGELADLLGSLAVCECHAFVEKAQAMPKNGAAGMFNYGTGYGTILGILAALRTPHTLIHPKTWTRVMHAGTRAGTAKNRSLEAARRLFPAVNLMRTDKCSKPDEGFIDALLIAGYGRRVISR